MQSDKVELIAEPGGRGTMTREGDVFVGSSGERYEIEGSILRTLKNVDPALALELAAQEKAVGDYEDPHLLMPRYERHVAEIAVVRLFGGSPPRGKILDAGCGIGMLGRLFPQLGLVGLDASIHLLRKASTGYDLLAEGSAEALPFKDGSFDVVVALNMLHHVISPDNAVKEFARVLRPGGTLVTVDPRKVAPVELVKQMLRGNDPTFAPSHKAFTIEEYRDIVEQHGLFGINEYRRFGLVSLLGMGGLDALRLSKYIPTPQLATGTFKAVDEVLFKLPLVPRAGLNLAVRATRR